MSWIPTQDRIHIPKTQQQLYTLVTGKHNTRISRRRFTRRLVTPKSGPKSYLDYSESARRRRADPAGRPSARDRRRAKGDSLAHGPAASSGDGRWEQEPARRAARRRDRGEGGSSAGRSLASTESLQGTGRKILINRAGFAGGRKEKGRQDPDRGAVVVVAAEAAGRPRIGSGRTRGRIATGVAFALAGWGGLIS